MTMPPFYIFARLKYTGIGFTKWTSSSQAGRPHEKAAGSARCRVVQASAPVRPASPEQNRTEDPMARQPWITPVTGAACAHGAGLHVVRPTVSDPDSPRQAGQAEASPATVQAAR